MEKIILLATLSNLLILISPLGYAQSVGVSTLGTFPDASALLDIDAAGMTPQKGLLIPRVALISITDAVTIASPQTSLLVYNSGTGGLTPAGYYYNQGTTGSPNWIPLLTNNVNSSAAWSITGNAGTTPSSSIYGIGANSNFIGTADAKDVVVASNDLERMRITSTGNVGIGTSSPTTMLDVKGEVKVGNTSIPCSAATEGSIRYNSTIKAIEWCDGTAWHSASHAGFRANLLVPTIVNNNPLTYVFTFLGFESEIFDDSYAYNPATGIYTAPSTGRYFFEANTHYNSVFAAGCDAYIALFVNGATVSYSHREYVGNTGNPMHIVKVFINLAAGDQVNVGAYLNACGISGSLNYGSFSGYRVY